MKLFTRISDVINKNLAVLAVAVSVFALLVPSVFIWLSAHISIDLSGVPFVGTHFPSLGFVNLLLGIVMLGMGMTLNTKDFSLMLKRPSDIVIGVLCQYVIMGGLGFLCAVLIRMPPVGDAQLRSEIALGMILLGAVPGGTAANVMSFLAKGDVPLSVAVIMCGTLIAPLLTSAVFLLLAGLWIRIEFLNMFFSIAFVVLLPILLGLLIHRLIGDRLEAYKKVLVLISALCVLMIVGTCVGTNRQSFTEHGAALVLISAVAVLMQHILGLAAGYAAAKLFHMNDAKAHTIALDTALQNSGLSCTLANSVFPGMLVILPCVLATVIHQIAGPIAANYFAKRSA